MSNSIPSGAVAAWIIVMLYTVLCLVLGILLFCLLLSNEKRYSYVLILSVFVSIATLASLIQQIHYAISWKSIKQGTFELRKQDIQDAGAAVSNGTHGVDIVLFWIQFYTYNANAILIFFWSMVLFRGTWRIDLGRTFSSGILDSLETFSKFFAILFPAFLIGIAQVEAIRRHNVVFAVICNACLVVSSTGGAILLVLTLWKFVQSRRSLNGSSLSSNQRSYGVTSSTNPHPNIAKRNQRAIDRSIITRFAVAFTLLTVFDIVNIIFQINSLNAASAPTKDVAPDFSTATAVSDILQFIPGVTCSLVAWAIWGTTKNFWAITKSFLRSIFCCGCIVRPIRKSIESERAAVGAGSSTARLRGEEGFTRLGSARDERMGNKIDIMVETELRYETELRELNEEGNTGRTRSEEQSGDTYGRDDWARTHGVTASRV